MQNLKMIVVLEITEIDFGKCGNLKELSKCQKSVIFSKFTKTKKVSPGNGLKKACAKFEGDRGIRSNRKRLWKSETADSDSDASGTEKILAILRKS